MEDGRLVMNQYDLYHFEFNKDSLQNINLVGVPKSGKDMLILKHLSGPIEHKLKRIFVHLLRGPKIRGGRGVR